MTPVRRIHVDDEIIGIIRDRMKLFNLFVIASLNFSIGVARNELDIFVDDRDSFLESNRKILGFTHPDFIKYLKSSGLTEQEINYCCLYCIGMKVREVMDYLDKRSIYNVNTMIRKKLKVSRHVNIDTFLHEKMKELDILG
ncbi:MAG: hypothetical protein NC115_01850 [Bacteroidales bacterium]|nr:hypothetical protein [Bacteroidales bacterium]